MTNPTTTTALPARTDLDLLHYVAKDVDARIHRLGITSDEAIRSGGHDSYLRVAFTQTPALDPGLHRAIEDRLHDEFAYRPTGHLLNYAAEIASIAVAATADYLAGR